MPLVKRLAARGRWAAAALIWASVAACGGGSGAPDAMTPSDGAVDTRRAGLEAAQCLLPDGGYGQSCNSCLAASCCTPIADCLGDGECESQLRCVVDCQNARDPGECPDACLGDRPHPSYLAYDDCSFDACLSSCWM